MNNLLDDDVNLDVELQEADNSYFVDQKQALESLKNKPFFNTLIEQGYFKDYAFELVMQLTDRGIMQNGQRNQILEKLVGISKLQRYFDMLGMLTNTEEGHEREMDSLEREGINTLTKLAAALEQAEKDPDFKLLVVNRYCTDYAASQTSLITSEHVINGGFRPEVLEALAGISTLRNYLVNIRKRLAYYAEDENDDDSEE